MADRPNPKWSAVAGLPDDALVEILSRLPVKDLHRSKCVSKAWRDLITDPLHHRKLPQTLQGFFYGGGDRGVSLLVTSAAPLVEPSFPFPPGTDGVKLLGSCNGFLLFEHGGCPATLFYIVCNPATGQWVAVPGGWPASPRCFYFRRTYLVFDPSVSSHFHILLFWEDRGEMGEAMVTVQAYSSKTGAWRHSEADWSSEEQHGQWEEWRHEVPDFFPIQPALPSAFVNGTVFLIMTDLLILEVDVEGKTRRIIRPPYRRPGAGAINCLRMLLLGQSQGRLHCVNQESVARDASDAEEWVLKHSVSLSHLFCSIRFDYRVIGIHADGNLVFILQKWNRQLIS